MFELLGEHTRKNCCFTRGDHKTKPRVQIHVLSGEEVKSFGLTFRCSCVSNPVSVRAFRQAYLYQLSLIAKRLQSASKVQQEHALWRLSEKPESLSLTFRCICKADPSPFGFSESILARTAVKRKMTAERIQATAEARAWKASKTLKSLRSTFGRNCKANQFSFKPSGGHPGKNGR